MQNGLPMGLFHPLIRLSFAAMQGDTGLLADALSYMAIRYRNIYQGSLTPEKVTTASTNSTAEQSSIAIKEVNETQPLSNRLPSLTYGGTIHVCEQLCSSTLVRELALGSGFQINQSNLQSSMTQICRAAAQLYLNEPALTTNHALTATQALADLTRLFAVDETKSVVFAKLWQAAWIWLTALFIEKNATFTAVGYEVKPKAARVIMDWKKLSTLALESNEVHVKKLVYSCKSLYEKINADPLYQQVAYALPMQYSSTVFCEMVRAIATKLYINIFA